MKQKKVRSLDDTRESKALSDFGTIGSASVGSYDTTEDLTDDTDGSSNLHRRKRGPDDNIRVRFAIKDNKLHKVESHSDFSPKERGAYWWSDREKDRMMAKHERLVPNTSNSVLGRNQDQRRYLQKNWEVTVASNRGRPRAP